MSSSVKIPVLKDILGSLRGKDMTRVMRNRNYILIIILSYFFLGLLTGISASQARNIHNTENGGSQSEGYVIGILQFYILVTIYTFITVILSILKFFRKAKTVDRALNQAEADVQEAQHTKNYLLITSLGFAILAFVFWIVMFFLILFQNTQKPIIGLGFTSFSLSIISLFATLKDPPYIFEYWRNLNDSLFLPEGHHDRDHGGHGGGDKQYRPIKYKKYKPPKPSKPKPGFFKNISDFLNEIF